MTSPINQMIDEACGVIEEPVSETASRIAEEVIYHIDTMYPAMWEGVAKAARTSVRNTVINNIVTAFDKS